ncbi:MAG: Flagellin N-methylase [Methanocella sp. PtaU1.Bin125]|nr:MAG: Flagellin N-methylase [Methanocella sp. PtaU1.Bin125]
MSVEGEIRRFRKDLKKARATSPDEIARRLPAFKCRRCAKCCRGAYGDNTVTVFPGEIRAIMAATGREWLEVVEPEEDGDVDGHGNRQAFEWALRKKPDGDCIFLEDGRCGIYEARPFICRTYPFYLDEGEIGAGECDGRSGERMSAQEARAMAEQLIARSVRELEESVGLLEKLDMEAGRGATGLTVVHDSEGSWLVGERSGARHFRGKARR